MAAGSARRRTQQERTDITTRALVGAARTLFAERGYEATLLDDVAAAAGVTKGALYHHFASKQELFAAVFEQEQRVLAGIVARAYAKERDAWTAFFAGCRAYLEASLDPGVRRIVLLDAPAVLGWQTVRRIESSYCFKQIQEGIAIAIRQRAIAPRPVEALSHILFGAICEAAMTIATADHARTAHARVLTELRSLLESLRSRRK
jgi:AcrR family transcriptional regulator